MLLLLRYLAIYLGLALLVAFIGRNHKLGFWGYFFASIVLTPVFGLVMVFASDPKKR